MSNRFPFADITTRILPYGRRAMTNAERDFSAISEAAEVTIEKLFVRASSHESTGKRELRGGNGFTTVSHCRTYKIGG